MRRMSVSAIVAIGLLAACAGPAPAPTALPPTQPVQAPTAAIVIVTLPPPPEATPTQSAPQLDASLYAGDWQLGLRFQFEGGAVMEVIRFVGGVTVHVADDGAVTGRGSLTTAVEHEGCEASILDDGQIPVTLEGALRESGDGMDLQFSLRPDDINRVEHYRLACATFTEPVEFEQQTLWPALAALNAQPYTLPLQPGASLTTTSDLSTMTNQALQGTLSTTIRLNR